MSALQPWRVQKEDVPKRLQRQQGGDGVMFWGRELAGPFRVPESANLCKTLFKWSLTCVYSDVPDELAGLFESLSTVMAAVSEPTAINVFLVVPGTIG